METDRLLSEVGQRVTLLQHLDGEPGKRHSTSACG
jgi:hypothetical protein